LRAAWAAERFFNFTTGHPMAGLFLHNVSKLFGTMSAVDPLSLEIPDGELVCLLGPSGSGKTTLLRMIGGFEEPSSGQIMIDGADVADVPPEKRPTAMVFQSHALWSHMNVFENVAFGLKLRGRPKAEIRDRVMATLDLVGLAGYEKRMPRQLSGGQQQRVAIARCIVIEPKILLMDEPFASLDQHLRERLREEVRQIQRKLRITTVFVTHGQDEALALADRIVVMSTGRIEQVGHPDEIYANPATKFVAGFIGSMNLIDASIAGGRALAGGFDVAAPVADGTALLAVRPEDFALANEGPRFNVDRVVNAGAYLIAEASGAGGTKVRVLLDKTHPVREGDAMNLQVRRYALFRGEDLLYRS
jgi:putative spermidine/putrescine transport system ATP-binding protein